MKKILCYGDSNTYGYDPRDGGRYMPKYRWVDIISSHGYNAINEGLNGREIPTSVNEYGYLNAILNRHLDADLIILSLGVNDAYNMRQPDAQAITDRWRVVFESVPAFNRIFSNRIPVILVSPPPGDTVMWGGDRADVIMDTLLLLPGEYRKLCEEYNIIFLDSSEWDINLSFDGVHLSESGNIVFAENILNCIAKTI